MKKLITLLLFYFVSIGISAQPDIPRPNIIPPSPDVANLMKFIEIPVSKYTGTPQISIPIYTIQEGNYSLPISLDYNAHGIKVSEIASYVGLGWSLNAGGVVSRSTNGLEDETGFGFLHTNMPNASDYINMMEHATGVLDNQPDNFYYSFAGHSGRFVFDKSGNIHTIPENLLKIEKMQRPVFNDINLQTGSIPSFFSDWIITTEEGIKYTFSDYEIGTTASGGSTEQSSAVISPNSPSVNSWYLSKIELPEGGLITFSYTTSDVYYDIYSGGNFVYSPYSGGGAPELRFVPKVAWTKMRTFTKRLNTISFSSGQVCFVPHIKERPDLLGDKALKAITVKNIAGSILTQFELDYQILQDTSLVNYESITIPETITHPGNRFHNQFNENYTISDAIKRRLILKGIVEKDSQGQAKNAGYEFKYYHDLGMPNRFYPRADHWGFANETEIDHPYSHPPVMQIQTGGYIMYGRVSSLNHSKQGTLYEIAHPTGGTTKFDYELHEYGGGVSMESNTTYSNKNCSLTAMSHYNYNGGGNNLDRFYEYKASPYNGAIVKQYYSEFTIHGSSISPSAKVNIVISGMTLYNPNDCYGFYIENVASHAILFKSGHDETTSLTLATGTYRIYHYPYQPALDNPNDPINQMLYQIVLNWQEEDQQSVVASVSGEIAGGLRVKKSTVYDPISSKSTVKTYTYKTENAGGLKISTGTLFGDPRYSYAFTEGSSSSGGGWSDRYYIVISFNSLYPLGSTQGSFVGYSRVEEETTDAFGEKNGKSSFEYTLNRENYPYLGNINRFPYPPGDSREWMNGLLIEQNDYAYQNDQYKLIRKQKNTWKESIMKLTDGYKFGITGTEMDSQGLLYSFDWKVYPISGGTMSLESREEQDVRNGTISTTKTYEYGTVPELPIHISQTESNGDKLHQYYSYPSEYASGGLFIDSLKAKNILNRPVEEVHTIENAAGLRITKGIVTEYNQDGTPSKIKQLETAQPVDKSSFRFSSRNAIGVLPTAGTKGAYTLDSRYKDKISVTHKLGRMSEYTTDAEKVVYLWGYNNQYPIAEITNATYAEVETAVKSVFSVASIDALSQLAIPNETKLKDGSLQTALSNAQVTTFTYKPLVGIETITDPRGVKVTYHYDDFGRLKYIKDENNKTIENYEYHYKNQ